MSQGTQEDFEILGKLIAADEAAEEPQKVVLVYTSSGADIIGHPGWPEGEKGPTDLKVDELEDLGWVRVTQRQGKIRHFAVTGEGRRAWQQHLARRSHVSAGRVSLEWSAGRRLLERIHDEYLEHGAPEMGVDLLPLVGDEQADATTNAQVRELARAGYLDVTFESADGPRMGRPTTLALQTITGWPLSPAQDALDELIAAALNSEIARTSDSQKRSKLVQVRDGLLGVARDIAIAWVERKVGAAAA